MLTAEALERVLNIVKSSHVPLLVQSKEKEAIKQVEFLLESYDNDDYDEEGQFPYPNPLTRKL